MYSAWTSSAAAAVSTDASAFARDPTSTNSVVGVSRRRGYTLIIMILYICDTIIRCIRVSAKQQARADVGPINPWDLFKTLSTGTAVAELNNILQ